MYLPSHFKMNTKDTAFLKAVQKGGSPQKICAPGNAIAIVAKRSSVHRGIIYVTSKLQNVLVFLE